MTAVSGCDMNRGAVEMKVSWKVSWKVRLKAESEGGWEDVR